MVRKRKTKALAVLTSLVMAVGAILAVPSIPVEAASVASVPMYRLYNPNSGEHFYTAGESERGNLVNLGWKYEGIGWYAPESSNTPVYRLYNPNTGDHHFTTNSTERKSCIKAGWKDEKIGWYSDDKKSVPLYREYNPNVIAGTHNYTTSKSEHNNLVSIGWKDEGIGWYGVTPPESNYNVGDTVILGSYEQDNNLSNGAEPIEWQVIGTRDGHTLLLSKYALDGKSYNKGFVDITWENCTLRSWLNNDFYNKAFSASDRKRIVTAHNENPDSYELYKPRHPVSSVYGADGGNATDDKVFLLSWTEARDYLDGKLYDSDLGAGNYNQKLLCRPTAYAKAQGVGTYPNSDNYYPSDTAGCCFWWLRSPGDTQGRAAGDTQGRAAGVGHDGALGNDIVYGTAGVRPVILLNEGTSKDSDKTDDTGDLGTGNYGVNVDAFVKDVSAIAAKGQESEITMPDPVDNKEIKAKHQIYPNASTPWRAQAQYRIDGSRIGLGLTQIISPGSFKTVETNEVADSKSINIEFNNLDVSADKLNADSLLISEDSFCYESVDSSDHTVRSFTVDAADPSVLKKSSFSSQDTDYAALLAEAKTKIPEMLQFYKEACAKFNLKYTDYISDSTIDRINKTIAALK